MRLSMMVDVDGELILPEGIDSIWEFDSDSLSAKPKKWGSTAHS